MSITLISLQAALPADYGRAGADDPMDRLWTTAFFKQPVDGPRYVSRVGMDGDGQADLRHHGGPDKALLAYSAEHYPRWNEELGRNDLSPGGFGENLTFTGCDEQTVCIGDLFEVGETLLQVSQPRQPCWKMARRWRIKDLPALVIGNGRGGWYLRVLRTGQLDRGQPAQLLERPLPEWTVYRVNRVFHHDKHDLASAKALADCELLADVWREDFRKRLEKADKHS